MIVMMMIIMMVHKKHDHKCTHIHTNEDKHANSHIPYSLFYSATQNFCPQSSDCYCCCYFVFATADIFRNRRFDSIPQHKKRKLTTKNLTIITKENQKRKRNNWKLRRKCWEPKEIPRETILITLYLVELILASMPLSCVYVVLFLFLLFCVFLMTFQMSLRTWYAQPNLPIHISVT